MVAGRFKIGAVALELRLTTALTPELNPPLPPKLPFKVAAPTPPAPPEPPPEIDTDGIKVSPAMVVLLHADL
jgi:hypothetical protein